MASKFNPYYKKLKEDKTIQWLKENDPNYSNKASDKGLEYPYLTVRKELFREELEIPISNLNKSEDYEVNCYIETGNEYE